MTSLDDDGDEDDNNVLLAVRSSLRMHGRNLPNADVSIRYAISRTPWHAARCSSCWTV